MDSQNRNFWRLEILFRVNLFRKADKKPIKADKKPIKTDREKMILTYVQENGSISNKEARELLGLAESTTKRMLREMVDEGKLIVEGSKRTRRYSIEKVRSR